MDFFTNPAFVPDPNPYFEHLRKQGRVVKEPHHGVMAVTGYLDTLAVFKDADAFSNCVSVGGPFVPLPFTPEGDDISHLIEQHRTELPLHEHRVAMDPPRHTNARSLLSRLLTPSRLKANQDFLWELADRQLDEFVDSGSCEFLTAYSKPFSLLAIADLLGVPRDDHEVFLDVLAKPHLMGNIEGEAASINPLEFLDDKFSAYISDRRAEHGDVPVRCGPGDDGQAARRRVANSVRPPGFAAIPPRRRQPDTDLHRRDPALGESGEDRLPVGAEV